MAKTLERCPLTIAAPAVLWVSAALSDLLGGPVWLANTAFLLGTLAAVTGLVPVACDHWLQRGRHDLGLTPNRSYWPPAAVVVIAVAAWMRSRGSEDPIVWGALAGALVGVGFVAVVRLFPLLAASAPAHGSGVALVVARRSHAAHRRGPGS
jgi:hypothetical protein